VAQGWVYFLTLNNPDWDDLYERLI
jgi:hypothetical protein